MADRIRDRKVREQVYSVFGPLSLLILLALWAVLLILGFGLMLLSIHSPFLDSSVPRERLCSLLRDGSLRQWNDADRRLARAMLCRAASGRGR